MSIPYSLRSLLKDIYSSCSEGQVLVKDSTEAAGVAPANNGGGAQNPFDQDLNTTDDVQFDLLRSAGLGIGDTPGVAGHLEWPEMKLYERDADLTYINPHLVLANPDAGAGIFVFHPYGVETLSFEPGAIFTSNVSFTLRAASGGTVQLTDADQANVLSFEAAGGKLTLPDVGVIAAFTSLEFEVPSLIINNLPGSSDTVTIPGVGELSFTHGLLTSFIPE